jgi:alkylresorcinol/alkylpyrone synthase
LQIASAATAFPARYYPQSFLTPALEQYFGEHLENPVLFRRLHAHCGVDGRHLALDPDEYWKIERWGQANDHWIDVAEQLGEQALAEAAKRAGIELQDIAALIFVSVTGIASPSIDARLVNRMKLSPNIRRVPVFGLGCVAGAAGISQAADYVRAWPGKIAALVSVELCSLTLQRQDTSVAHLISSGLFGDGAAAVLVGGSDSELNGRRFSGPTIVATKSSFYPDTHRVMGWDISERGFNIVLSPDVPNVVRQNLRRDTDAFLAEHGLTRKDIGCWLMHTGGPKVLEATEDALEISREATQVSWDCLRRVGNLSSASVLMVLEEVMLNRRPAPGTWSVLAAMGPGFCAELVLLRW